VTIPDRLLKRFTSLEVTVRTTGDPGALRRLPANPGAGTPPIALRLVTVTA
jgi:hypothetical protein